MAALPSFVELMASLGLDNKNKSSPPPPHEFSSPSIVVSSEHDPIHEHISSRIRVARYSPYGAPIVSPTIRLRLNRSSQRSASQSHSHRRSASTLSSDGTDSELPNRVGFRDRGSVGVVANTPSQNTSPRRRPSALKLGPESRHRHINDPESSANMPISTFVRRKTPTSSPVSPTFAHRNRRRSQSPTINPVSLPTLPPVFVSHIPHKSGGSPAPSSPAESDDENNHVPRRAERLTPDYFLVEDGHVVISSFPGNNLAQRCVSPLA